MNRKLAAGAVAAVATAVCAPVAGASQLIDRNATEVKLVVDAKGAALVTYTAGGHVKHVRAWGAVNAVPPTRSRKQVAFSLDYSGGRWQSFGGVCLAYDGPALAWKTAACKAPDGSYWALQSWQRGLPNYGLAPNAKQSVWELRLSHWTGAIPELQISTDWAYRRYDHLFGTFTYGGVGVYGFASSPAGNPLDTFGRNIYVDTLSSKYGAGWKRENSFLTHADKGSFCYGFYPHGPRPAGAGVKYRATAEGPGVAPDPLWEGDAPGPFDATTDAQQNAAQRSLADAKCRQA